jgi:hypothetical protein
MALPQHHEPGQDSAGQGSRGEVTMSEAIRWGEAPPGPRLGRSLALPHYVGWLGIPNLSAILTSSARDLACIFCMM